MAVVEQLILILFRAAFGRKIPVMEYDVWLPRYKKKKYVRIRG